MPLLSIETNVEQIPNDFITEISQKLAENLGKPEMYVMVKLTNNQHMSFSGTTDPLAYLELKSLGLPDTKTPELSAFLCETVASYLSVDPSRIYIEFAAPERHHWGWNNGTF